MTELLNLNFGGKSRQRKDTLARCVSALLIFLQPNERVVNAVLASADNPTIWVSDGFMGGDIGLWSVAARLAALLTTSDCHLWIVARLTCNASSSLTS